MTRLAECFFCKKTVPRANAKSKAVLCGDCVQRLTGSPESIGKVPGNVKLPKAPKAPKEPKPTKVTRAAGRGRPRKNGAAPKSAAPTGRGRGWHLKKRFVDADGTVYSFGQEVSDGES